MRAVEVPAWPLLVGALLKRLALRSRTALVLAVTATAMLARRTIAASAMAVRVRSFHLNAV
jgi:hypothetical protein